jgi:tetratricopeptide (TPR) repeat protein
LEDGSILAGGANPDKATYTFIAPTDVPKITALRFEAMAHESLGKGGSGRGSWGNFALSEISVQAEPLSAAAEAVTLKLINPRADFEQDTYPVAASLDGNPGPAWSVDPRVGMDHEAVFEVESSQPSGFEGGTRLTFTLGFQYNNKHALGRFRLSVSGNPATLEREQTRLAALKVTDPWTRLAAAYHVLGDQGPLERLLEHHPAAAVGRGDLFAADQDWERAILGYRKALTGQPNDGYVLARLAAAYQAAGRTREAVPHLAALSAAQPQDTDLLLKVAALQAWFAQEKEFAVTRRRALATARGTRDASLAERTAKAVSLLPSTDRADVESALALARTAVALVKGGKYNLLALGLAQYRSGNDVAAEEALVAVAKEGSPAWLPGIAVFYRAMSLFRRGKPGEARKLAAGAAARMKPFPRDEENPLAAAGPDASGNRHADNLILWLAYKEAKAVIQFDATPAVPSRRDAK